MGQGGQVCGDQTAMIRNCQLDMKRRQFMTRFGGAVAAWPLAARAQQRERVGRIGVLMSFAADDPSAPPLVSAFAQGLQERGWVVGGNVRIDYRWGASDLDR